MQMSALPQAVVVLPEVLPEGGGVISKLPVESTEASTAVATVQKEGSVGLTVEAPIDELSLEPEMLTHAEVLKRQAHSEPSSLESLPAVVPAPVVLDATVMHAVMMDSASPALLPTPAVNPLLAEVPPTALAGTVLPQVESGIRQGYNQQQQTLTLQMSPEQLGRVVVQLKSVGEGEVRAKLLVESPEAMKAVQQDIEGLRQRLSEQGVTLSEVSVDTLPMEMSGTAETESSQQEESFSESSSQQSEQESDAFMGATGGMDAGFFMNQQSHSGGDTPTSRYESLAQELALQQTMIRLNKLDQRLNGVSSPFQAYTSTESASVLSSLERKG
jgi:flagellar hook-length control protein FliK